MIMRKNILNTALLLLLAFVAGACSDSDTTKTVDNGRRSGAGSILELLSTDEGALSTLNFSLGANSYIVGINCDGDWTASVDADWVTLSNYAGYGFANKYSYDKISVSKNMGEERTATVTFTTGSISKTIAITQKGAGADPDDPFETSFELVENLVMGYNLGNTLDANPWGDWWDPSTKTIADWETSWGQPLTTQEIIDAIAEKGFNIIRVPVTWYPHVDADDKISEEWMTRVEEVVNYVLNAGCYCILNVQHDTGAADGRTDGGAWLYADIDDYPTQTVRYQKFWQQIAERFKNYDEHLIFESFNEILNKSYSWTAPSSVEDGAYQAINKLQQDFVNVVRATGGNNRYRNLAITTYAATGTSDVALQAFELPTDPSSNHLYLSIHSYDPYNFCNYNAGKNQDGSEYDYNIYVFNEDCEATIDGVFARVSKRASEVGIPFIFGEFGAIDESKSMSERIKYAKYLKTKFQQYETAGLWWMGLYDRKKAEWYESEIVDVLFQ
jgi:endoglucanase